MVIFNVIIWGAGGVLSQISHKIYSNSHKPSWETLKHHLLRKKPKETPKEIEDVAETDKKDDFKPEMMFGWASKYRLPIPSGKWAKWIFGIWHFATFLHIRDTFLVSRLLFLRGPAWKRTKRQRRFGGK